MNESVTISSNGLVYDTPGMILQIDWKDIEKISHCWKFSIRQECLVVDQGNVKIKEWHAFRANTYSHPLENYLQNIAIPLNSFSDNWRDSELGQQIKLYAPHLFEEKSVQSAD